MGRIARLSAFLIAITFVQDAWAQEACEPVVGSVESVEGLVELERAGTFRWQPAALGAALCEADSVRVGPRSRAALRLVNDAVLRLDQNTTLQLTEIRSEPEERSLLQLVAGVLQSFSRRPRLLAINTPYLNATIEGTEFVIAADEREGSITVLEGVVRAANDLGEVRLASGEAAVAAAGAAPVQRIVVRPREAVQWALYYPPILAAQGGQADAAELPPALAEAMALLDAGDLAGAFARLDAVPEGARDAEHHVYRAALLLSVGRVEDAQAAIGRALAADPEAGLAYAQRAIIELVRNEEEAALASARRAVELSPDSAAAKIALSYALQARFELEAARDVLLQAVEQQPRDALAWARLSELWLMLGERGRAREAAERAVALAPDIERTQITLGFADLVEFDTAAAKEAFERAIALAPADPLPRLGLGLAQIREGDLEQGRESLEVAVGLNANDALLRAYLGKAYFEETRDDIANEQYAMAQELDPLDPTAYLYEAIKQQTENRPVEALENLQKSIELNDNRAVYRSRLLLDSDRAARGASLARIYDDLGFQDQGVREATKSLSFDPTNPAAHRFLSDVYADVRRRQQARVSELLQAQLLQDININPVQPSLSETRLNLIAQGGPADAGFNEFTPLFERQQAQVNATGVVGNNDTYGGEGVVSMLYDRYSLSVGTFNYESDGWRENADVKHDIQNAFFQTAITPDLTALVELRHRNSNFGDLVFNFDPDDFFPNFENKIVEDNGRVGARYSPTPNSDILVTAGYTDFHQTVRDSGQAEVAPGVVLPFTTRTETKDNGYSAEAQYLYRLDRFNAIAGGGYSFFDRDLENEVTLGGTPIDQTAVAQDITDPKGYTYFNLRWPDPVLWTVGVSYDNYEEGEIHTQAANPKFGVQWFITDDLVLRGAAFQVVTPSLAGNRTLEPTQVAGFNQLYDEASGTKSQRYAVGFDWRILDTLSVGAEASYRDIDFAVNDFREGDSDTFHHDEYTYGGYVYWTPFRQLALSAEFIYDKFHAEDSFLTTEGEFPEDLETFSIPLEARYFHPSGVFATFGATYVNQDVDRSDESFFADGNDDFFLLDASLGYRFPGRLGIASIGVTNLLDQNFHYQDDGFRDFTGGQSSGPYFPDRQILARLTLSF